MISLIIFKSNTVIYNEEIKWKDKLFDIPTSCNQDFATTLNWYE